MTLRTFVTAIVVVVATGTVHGEARRELTFAEALAVALAHNGELYVSRTDTEIAADDVALARSAFDPRLIVSARMGREDQLGSYFRFNFTDDVAIASVAVTGRATTGATYTTTLSQSFEKYESPFVSIYNPANTTALTVAVSQPLMRNAWRAVNRQPIVVASLRREVSEQQLRVRLEQIVGAVEAAYWTLALAHNEVEARQASLQLAEQQLGESKRLIRLGTISDLDVVEAQAGVGRMQRQLIVAQQQVVVAEGELRRVIVGDPAWQPDEALIPVDPPTMEPVEPSMGGHLELARKHRPDVIAVRAQLDADNAELGITANELRPQLDLIVTAGLFGFAGTLDTTSGAVPAGFTPNPTATGGAARALANLVTAGNYAVSVGVRLELPIVNSAAQARHDHQRHAVSRVRIAERALLAQVENDVRTSLARVRVDEQLARAADEAVKTHEQLLAGMHKRFSAGAVTSYDILRVADELTRARIEAARARVSYRISVARLAIADGTLLDRYKITVSSLHAKAP